MLGKRSVLQKTAWVEQRADTLTGGQLAAVTLLLQALGAAAPLDLAAALLHTGNEFLQLQIQIGLLQIGQIRMWEIRLRLDFGHVVSV